MAESAYLGMRGAEISERSAELVLPGSASPETREPMREMRERKTGVSEPEASYGRVSTAELTAEGNPTTEEVARRPDAPAPASQRGIALPGDRGRESPEPSKQRPSFWRRIALGRRASKTRDDAQPTNQPIVEPPNPAAVATRARPAPPQTADSIERRIVEPLLQALVSVEAKLERSHIDLVGRSESVEQRLSQLWDIEEQLGTLSEIQESLLRVSEQQRRLEATIALQNTTLRWLVGAVFTSLAVAAFVVAAVLN